jgi:hypothetical protein
MTTIAKDNIIPDDVPLLCSSSNSTGSTSSDSSDNDTRAIVRDGVGKEINKQVVRQKLNKLRHLVLKEAILPEHLDEVSFNN